MSNLAIPAHLLNRTSRGLAAAVVQGIGGNMPPHVSIKDNRFTLVDAGGNEKQHDKLYLEVVIADVNPAISKVYYEGKYDPKAENVGPTCFSDNGVGPSSQATKPQNAVCSTCPMNAWGSAVSQMTGKQTKACNDAKKIAVIVPELGNDMVFLLRIPPASLKNLAAYARTLSGMSLGSRPAEPSDVVTRVSFESQGVLRFEPTSFIDERVCSLLEALDVSDKTAAIVGRDDVVVGALPAPKTAVAIAAPAFVAPAPAPAPAPSAEVEAFAPKRTRAKVAAPVVEEAPIEIPAFLRKDRAPAPAPAPTSGFGMTAAPAPDNALQSALANAFKLPVG